MKYRPQEGYLTNYKDMGCKRATDYLGYQSECLDCPFSECIEVLVDNTRAEGKRMPILNKFVRDQAIQLAWVEGKTQREIAKEFGIHIRTVQRVLRRETPLREGVLV